MERFIGYGELHRVRSLPITMPCMAYRETTLTEIANYGDARSRAGKSS